MAPSDYQSPSGAVHHKARPFFLSGLFITTCWPHTGTLQLCWREMEGLTFRSDAKPAGKNYSTAKTQMEAIGNTVELTVESMLDEYTF